MLKMGKHKKKIRNTFKDWDNVTPEDQMRNADEFFNINKNNVESLGDLGISDKVFVDKETGLEAEIVNDIINSFGGSTNEPEFVPATEEVPFYDDKDEAVPESVKRVLDSLNNTITSQTDVVDEEPEEESDVEVIPDAEIEPKEEEDIELDSYFTQVNNEEDDSVNEDLMDGIYESNMETADDEVEDDIPVEDKKEEEPEDEDKFIDVRCFGCTIRSGLGIVKFDDGIAPFTLNEHVAMLEDLTRNSDSSLINDDIIELFKKALIINRYPAAIYTKEEFISSNILPRGKFVQGECEHAVFVDVLNKYIAVYFVKNIALNRFDDSITDIIPAPMDEFGDPRANVWAYLGAILDTDRFSFANDSDIVELFYESDYNEKELVAEYIREKYIDSSVDAEIDIDIIGRDSVENKFNYVIDMIITDDEDDEEADETEEPKEEPLSNNQEALVEALKKKAEEATAPEKKDDSMVIPVHHKEAKK